MNHGTRRFIARLLTALLLLQMMPVNLLAQEEATVVSPSITFQQQVDPGATADGGSVQTLSMVDQPLPSVYKVTINYRIGDANSSTEAYPSYLGTYVDGTTFSVNSPAVTGYAPTNPAEATITGTLSGSDYLYTVYYSPSSVNYQVRHW